MRAERGSRSTCSRPTRTPTDAETTSTTPTPLLSSTSASAAIRADCRPPPRLSALGVHDDRQAPVTGRTSDRRLRDRRLRAHRRRLPAARQRVRRGRVHRRRRPRASRRTRRTSRSCRSKNCTRRTRRPSYAMLVAIGFSAVNRARADVYARCKERGYELISYVNSRATAWGDIEMGDNCFVFEENVIQPNVTNRQQRRTLERQPHRSRLRDRRPLLHRVARRRSRATSESARTASSE